MKKVDSINVYIKDGKIFAVIKCNGVDYSINGGLLKYAINNPKTIKNKEGK